MGLPRKLKVLWYDSLVSVCQKFHLAFLTATDSPSTSRDADHLTQWQNCLYGILYLLQSFLTLGLTQNRQPFRLLGKWFGVSYSNEEICCFQNSKRSIKHCDLFLSGREADAANCPSPEMDNSTFPR